MSNRNMRASGLLAMCLLWCCAAAMATQLTAPSLSSSGLRATTNQDSGGILDSPTTNMTYVGDRPDFIQWNSQNKHKKNGTTAAHHHEECLSFWDTVKNWVGQAISSEENTGDPLSGYIKQLAQESMSNGTSSVISLRRSMSENKWAEFNRIFTNASLHLPSIKLEKTLVFKLTLWINDPWCEDIAIDDLELTLTPVDNRQLKVLVNLTGLDITCYSRYEFTYGTKWLPKAKGKGQVDMYTRDNYAQAELLFTTPTSFDVAPPNHVEGEVLVAKFFIYDLDFDGDWVSGFLDAFEKLFREFVEDQLQKAARNELGSLASEFLKDVVDETKAQITPYLAPIPPHLEDALKAEKDFLAANPDLSPFVDFQNLQENSLPALIADLLGEADKMFGRTVSDPGSPTGTGFDLGVNTFFRKTLLAEDRSLEIKIENLPFEPFDTVIFSSHDAVSKTSIMLTGFYLVGLDTFKRFDPLVDVGKFTLQNAFHLDTLAVELEFFVKIQPSDFDDAILRDADMSISVEEHIRVSFGVDDLELVLSLLLVIKNEPLVNMQLGSLLRQENIIACLGSIVHDLKIAGLAVSVSNIHEPVLKGFISPGIDHLVTTAANAVFHMYEPTFLKALGHLFQSTIREILQDELWAFIEETSSTNKCGWDLPTPVPGLPDSVIDFRDFFLPADQASAFGATGLEPYGNIGSIGYELMQEQFVEVNGYNSIAFNDLVVNSVTRYQSGYPGMLTLPETELVSVLNERKLQENEAPSLWKNLVSDVDLSVNGGVVHNLNTVHLPLLVLNPKPLQATTLANELNVGGQTGRPDPAASARLVLVVKSATPSPLTFNDEIEFSLTMDSFRVLADVVARIGTLPFMSLPLQSIMDFNCWLAMIPEPEEGSSIRNLELETIVLELNNLLMSSYVISGSSGGIASIPTALDILQDSGFVALLASRVQALVTEILQSAMVGDMVENLVRHARAKCPSSPSYDPTFDSETLDAVASLALSPTAVDTVLYGAIGLAQTFFIALMENHLSFQGEMPSLPPFSVPSNMVLDWTNIGESLDLGEVADEAFQMARDYVGGTNDAGELNVNNIVNDLNEDGFFSFDLSGLTVNLGDLALDFKQLSLAGLNTFTKLDVLNPINSQTLSSTVALNELDVELRLSLSSGMDSAQEVRDVTLSFSVSEMEATLDLVAAFEIAKLLDLQLGSLLHMEDILPCLVASAHAIGIERFAMSVGSFGVPQVTGLLPETSSSMSQTLDALYDQFMNDVVGAIPTLFDTTVRQLVNNYLERLIADNSGCPDRSVDLAGILLDFRDLFLKGEKSVALGGLGTEPFGDLAVSLYGLIEDVLTGLNDDGDLKLNDLVRSATEAQSGEAGKLDFEDMKLVSFSNPPFDAHNGVPLLENLLTGRVEFVVDGLEMLNMDTLVPPLQILNPTLDPHALENQINVGKNGEPDNLSARAQVAVVVEGSSALALDDKVEVEFSVGVAHLLATAVARIRASSLMGFPLRYLLNVDCLLTLFPVHEFLQLQRKLALDSVTIELVDVVVRASVLAGSSAGVQMIPSILKTLESTGATALLSSRLGSLASEYLESDMASDQLENKIRDGHSKCPLSPSFGNDQAFKAPGNFTLSPEALDTTLYGGVLLAQAFFFALLENHLFYEGEMNPSHDIPESVDRDELLDWTDLSSSLGLGDAVDEILELGRDFIGGRNDDGELNVNVLVRDLSKDGALVLDLRGTSFEVAGHSFEVTEIILRGLDTFTGITILEPLGPQSLSNKVSLDQLSVSVGLKLSAANDAQEVRLVFGLRGVEAEIELFAAFDAAGVLDTKLGSLLYTEDILPCLLSSAFSVGLDRLVVAVNEFNVPEVTGLMPETSLSMNQTLDALFNEFSSNAKAALPKFFNTTIKQVVNNYFQDLVSRQECPDRASETQEFIEISEVFEEDAGLGDLLSTLRDFAETEFFLAQDGLGFSKLNDLVRPMTERQSGVPGELSFPGSFFDVALRTLHRVGVDSVELDVGNLTVNNLDTIEAPVVLLEQNAKDPTILDNHMRLGVFPSPLRVMLNAMLGFSGGEFLTSHNELEVAMDLAATEISASIRARVRGSELMSFPLRELGNYNCWLSLFGAPSLDDNGVRLPGEEAGLSIHHLSLAAEAMRIYASCRGTGTCTTSSISSIGSILSEYENRGSATLLQKHVFAFVDELTSGTFFQTFLDRLLADAAEQCSLTRSATQASRIGSFPLPQLPPLSSKMLDSLVFAAAYFAEIGLVVAFKAHESYVGVDVDPLLPQAQLVESPGVDLIDFGDLASSVGVKWADTLMDKLRSYAGEMVDDGNNGEDLGINVLLRSALLDDSGLMVFDLSEYSLDEPAMSITLGDISIRGLDSVSDISLMEVVGPQTLRNRATLDHVTVGLEVKVRTPETDMDGYIELAVDNLQLDASIFAAIDKTALGGLELGQILDSDKILRCLLISVHALTFPVLDISMGKVKSFRIEGFDDPAVQADMERMTRVSLDLYEEMILQNMGRFFNFSIKAILNNWLEYYLAQESTASCPRPSRALAAADDSPVDFRDLLLAPDESKQLGGKGNERYGDIIRTVVNILNDNVLKVDPETGLSSVNSVLISDLTESQSNVPGRLFFAGDLLSFGQRIQIGGLDLSIDLRVHDGYINNLDTVGEPFSILDPVLNKPSNLNNTLAAGLGEPLTFGARFFLSIVGSEQEIINDLDVSLGMETVSLILEALLHLSEDRFFSFPLRDLVSPDCLISMMPARQLDQNGIRVEGEERSAGLVNLAIAVALVKLNITCAGACSPGMPELAALLSTSEASNASTEVANDVLDYATDMLGGSYLQVSIDRMINEAHRNCPSSPLYSPNAQPLTYDAFKLSEQEESVRFLVMLGISAGCIISALLVVMLTVKTFVLCRHRRWLASLSRRDLENVLNKQTSAQDKEGAMNETSTSMFNSPEIPRWVRLSMPLIILGNIAFFLSGHLSLGGTVNIVASLGGATLKIDNFFEFSIMETTIEIWNAGGTELAIMILIFSVIWPYTKQLITLALWFAPPSRVSISRRGSFFVWLDTLAKWSMVDIMTLIVTIAAFRVSIQSPDVAFLPDGFYSVDLVVVPLWGLYANMIAQLISQISSHFIIFYHRRIAERASRSHDRSLGTAKSSLTLPMDQDDSAENLSDESLQHADRRDEGPQERLCTHAFYRPHRTAEDRLLVRRAMNPMVVLGFIVTSALAVVGCVVASFSVEILGFIGVVVESGQGFSDAKQEHSVFTIVNLLSEQADFTGRGADKIGLGALSALLIFSVLIVPFAQSAVLVYVWFSRLNAKQRQTMSVVVETLQAWQYAEVYIISVVVSSWQLGPVSDFMINSYCNSLDETFAQLVYHGILKEEDAQCFRVEAAVENGSYILAGAAVALALVNTFVMKAVTQSFRDLERVNETNQQDLSVVAHPLNDDDESSQNHGESSRALARQIRPVPVLFTDTFRWCMVREDAVVVQAQTDDSSNGKSSSRTPPHDVPLVGASEADLMRGGSDDSLEELDDEPPVVCYSEVEESTKASIRGADPPSETTTAVRQFDELSEVRSVIEPLSTATAPPAVVAADTQPDMDTSVGTSGQDAPTSSPPVDVPDFEYLMDTLMNESQRTTTGHNTIASQSTRHSQTSSQPQQQFSSQHQSQRRRGSLGEASLGDSTIATTTTMRSETRPTSSGASVVSGMSRSTRASSYVPPQMRIPEVDPGADKPV